MFKSLSRDPQVFMQWDWAQLKPFADELVMRPLSASSLPEWIMDWSDLSRLLSEMYARLWVATTQNTINPQIQERFNIFLDKVHAPWLAANQKLKKKLLESQLHPEGFRLPLLNMQVESEIYRDENLSLLVQEQKMVNEYDGIISTQTVMWRGEEITTTQLQPIYLRLDRTEREEAWHLEMDRKLADRQRLNQVWANLFTLRNQIAMNAGQVDYRLYKWKDLHRFNYTPDDCNQFHDAIEQVVVPAAKRLYEKRQKQLNLNSLRPWDLHVDPLGREPLKPYRTVTELEDKVATIFHKIDPQLGEYFETMRRQGLLDLENRKGKAPGAYCNNYDMVRLPFIFENAVGLHTDVATLIHEGGHAFHVFEAAQLPYYHQLAVGMEFAEVASMSMELLASPYLPAKEGGFYDEKDTARACIEHLEESLLFWPYMAVVDAFQHWAYTNQAAAANPDNCDQKWGELWRRYMIGVDWSGLDNEMVTGWQRKIHIFEVPFYYVEYGLASMGAFQVWSNALKDQEKAVADYRRALALGGSASIPDLFSMAGAHFAMDPRTLSHVINLIEDKIDEYEQLQRL